MKKHTVAVLNPGHFHAALSLRESHPALADDVYVYAPDGEELQAFCNFIRDFNARPQEPTRWNLHVRTGEDSLAALLREKKADVAILAGRNDTKMRDIESLNRAGIAVFADKPWATEEGALKFLNDALGRDRPLTVDIMTERFEIATILQKIFLAEPEVFGTLRVEPGKPTVYKESVHHLFKLVNGKVLRRPPWYFDVKAQGEGVVDVTAHLVDMTHWMAFPGQTVVFEKDIRLLEARRWATPVPLETFTLITRHFEFPAGVLGEVRNDVLSYYCNGDIAYTVKDVPVHIRVIWNLEGPLGSGDTHRSIIRGTKADLMVRQLPEKGYVTEFVIAPHGDPTALAKPIQAALDRHGKIYPGLFRAREGSEFLIEIPKPLRTTHEQHFGEARGVFLDMLEKGGEPPELRTNIVTKYTLLVEARKKALASPCEKLATA